MTWRLLELFAGIGGAARAFAGLADVEAAIDINQNARLVYESNFGHRYLTQSIENFDSKRLANFDANIWWISAPCQPFTRRGNRLDDQDPRTFALLHIAEQLETAKPDWVMLENVIGFSGSRTHARLIEKLGKSKYSTIELARCPTELGIPNRRPRYYLIASRTHEPKEVDWSISSSDSSIGPIAKFLDPADSEVRWLEASDVKRYHQGLNVVRAGSTTTTCFTSGYGKSWSKSGSYLMDDIGRVRRFSPDEVARLLGFLSAPGSGQLSGRDFASEDWVWPDQLNWRQRWKLLGNSISIFVVRDLVRRVLALKT